MSTTTYLRGLFTLLTNHMDAWGLTLVIGTLCLVIHSAISADRIGLLLVLGVTCWLAFAFNDYCDAPYDAQDEGKRRRNFFVLCPLPRRYLAIGALVIVGALFAAYAGYGERGLIVFGVSLGALWAYSAPPLRLKSRPGFDLVMHAVFVQTFPYFACLVLIGATWTALDFVMLTVFALSSLAAQLEQQARDFAVDSRTDTNFATAVGLRPTVWLLRAASILFSAVLIAAFATRIIPMHILPFGLIGLPVVAHRFIRRANQPRSQRLVTVAILLALLYMGGIWSVVLLRLG